MSTIGPPSIDFICLWVSIFVQNSSLFHEIDVFDSSVNLVFDLRMRAERYLKFNAERLGKKVAYRFITIVSGACLILYDV